MSIKRMTAVILIFVSSCLAWVVLGIATTARSSEFFSRLGARVEQLWGTPLNQSAPSVSVRIPGTDQDRGIMPKENRVDVDLQTDYRQKGLIWYPTYICSFQGVYTITNTEPVTQKYRIGFAFPAPGGTYDDFVFAIDGRPLAAPIDTRNGVTEIVELDPGQSARFQVGYRTRGIREWRYRPDSRVNRMQDFRLTVRTNFRKVDYTEGSLSPMSAVADKDGMTLAWKASDLITSGDIGILIPEKLNPGPLTSRITFFAPVCLLFFFILVATINILYRVPIHPMHYLFVAAGFFAFHLLLSYMAGLVPIHAAFAVAAATSVTLVTGYLSGALRGRFPWKIAAAGQIFFLVLFSYSFFFKGITGLTVAIGSVLTLAILMKVTLHVDWNNVLRGDGPAPASPADGSAPPGQQASSPATPPPIPPPAQL